ncbi:MarR family transcriptional regulator [Streptomyces sp. NPDC020362]|uniref:MarR family winged helix-turn-helix transcriptional regulator n=1 Tax=unclassified Streptomyces TaxID=2593676 RepID=UPI000B1222CC
MTPEAEEEGPDREAMAATLGVNPSAALRMVERLESLGLIDRRVNPDNRREVVLRLTREGQGLVDRALGHRRAAIRALVERLPARERAGLVPALRALTSAADNLVPPSIRRAKPVPWPGWSTTRSARPRKEVAPA